MNGIAETDLQKLLAKAECARAIEDYASSTIVKWHPFVRFLYFNGLIA